MKTLLKSIFSKSNHTEDQLPDPSNCMVNISLGGEVHSFYLPEDFAERLSNALEQPNVEGLFTYDHENGDWYAINLDYVGYVSVLKEGEGFESNDDEGYTVYLQGEIHTIPFEEVGEANIYIRDGLESPFIKIGSHYFNRGDVVMVLSKGWKAACETKGALTESEERAECDHDWQPDGQTMTAVRWTCTKCQKTRLS